jgi:hypothetical protein
VGTTHHESKISQAKPLQLINKSGDIFAINISRFIHLAGLWDGS